MDKSITTVDMIEAPQVSNLSALTATTPAEMINKATTYATALAEVIKARNLFTTIGAKNHVNIEGWSTLGTLLGVMPYIEWSRQCMNEATDGDIGYEARCVLKTMTGQIVGSGEAMATKSEKKPWSNSHFSIRSMAETRATGKAFRLSFAWIMKLAGYDGLPTEEVVEDKPKAKKAPIETSTEATQDNINEKVDAMEAAAGDPIEYYDQKASPKQVKMIFGLCKQLNIANAEFVKEWIKNEYNYESLNDMDKDVASEIIDDLQNPLGDPKILIDWKKETPMTSKEKVHAKAEEFKQRGTPKVQSDLMTADEVEDLLVESEENETN